MMKVPCNAPDAGGFILYGTEYRSCSWIHRNKIHCKNKLLSKLGLSRFHYGFHQCAEIIGKGRAKIGPLQRKFHGSFQEAKLVACIMALAFKGIAVNFFSLAQ